MKLFNSARQTLAKYISGSQKVPNEAVSKNPKRESSKLRRQRPFRVELGQDNLELAIMAAQDPYNPRRMLLYEYYREAERNLKLFGQMRTSTIKVLKEPWAVVDNKTGEIEEELTKILQKKWFRDLSKHIIQSEFYGHSLIEFGVMVEPQPQEKGLADMVFTDITLIPREHVRPETGELLVYPMDSAGVPYREDPFNTWFLEAGNPFNLGLLMYACRYCIYKKFELSDWSRSSERWSDPLLWIQSSSDDEAENDKKQEFAENFGNNGYGITQKDDVVTLLQRSNSGSSHKIYDDFLNYLDNEIAQGVNGQESTADEKSFAGSADVHERLLDDYTEDRLYDLKDFHNENTFPFLIKKGYKLDGKSFMPLKFMKKLQDPNIPDPNDPNDPRNQDQNANDENDGGVPKKKALGLNLGPEYLNCECGEPLHHMQLSYESPLNMDLIIQRAIKRMHERKVKAGRVDAELVRANAEALYKGVKEGIKKKPESLDFGSAEHRLLMNMKHNVHVTAVFKNYHNSLEMAGKLFDEKGNIRPFSKFAKEVKPIAEVYNKDYLQAEYQTAIASARMGMKWQGFVKKGGKLQYKTQLDGRVREEHKGLEGVVKPVNDTFWDVYYPPNGWRCRCYVRWVPDNTPVVEPSEIPEVKPIFRHNVGKTGKVFTEEHPYFKVEQKDSDKANQSFGLQMPISPERFERNVSLYNRFSNDVNFILEMVDNQGGGYLFRHKNSDLKELPELLKIGKKLALNQAESVIINPILRVAGIKNPDFTLSGLPAELKIIHSPTKGAIDNAIRAAKNQAHSIILELPDTMNVKMAEDAIYNRVQRTAGINEIRVIYKGNLYLLKREEIINKTFKGKIR
jgi:SPP1 gp7 family putative phage head morphogenesis protein